MTIWHGEVSLKSLNQQGAACANGRLGIELIEIGDDWIRGRMPVDDRTRQPFGALHGGASVLFAETLGSWGAIMTVDRERFRCVGQEINANHVRAVTQGLVYGIARPAHLGRTSQVWDVRITDERDKLVCVSRLTVAVLPVSMRG